MRELPCYGTIPGRPSEFTEQELDILQSAILDCMEKPDQLDVLELCVRWNIPKTTIWRYMKNMKKGKPMVSTRPMDYAPNMRKLEERHREPFSERYDTEPCGDAIKLVSNGTFKKPFDEFPVEIQIPKKGGRPKRKPPTIQDASKGDLTVVGGGEGFSAAEARRILRDVAMDESLPAATRLSALREEQVIASRIGLDVNPGPPPPQTHKDYLERYQRLYEANPDVYIEVAEMNQLD